MELQQLASIPRDRREVRRGQKGNVLYAVCAGECGEAGACEDADAGPGIKSGVGA